MFWKVNQIVNKHGTEVFEKIPRSTAKTKIRSSGNINLPLVGKEESQNVQRHSKKTRGV